MSYFNDFAAGYQMTSGKRERDRDRTDKIDQEKLRKEFEVGRDVARYKAEQDRQGERINADAKRQFNQNFFTSGERAAGENFTTGRDAAQQGYTKENQTNTQNFAANEADLGRTLQDDIVNRQLSADAKKVAQADLQFGKTQDYNYANMGLMAGLKAREEEARTDPLSLTNQINNQKLIKLTAENANAGPLAGGKPATGDLPILTPAEAKAAKPGTRYRTQDGRQMIR